MLAKSKYKEGTFIAPSAWTETTMLLWGFWEHIKSGDRQKHTRVKLRPANSYKYACSMEIIEKFNNNHNNRKLCKQKENHKAYKQQSFIRLLYIHNLHQTLFLILPFLHINSDKFKSLNWEVFHKTVHQNTIHPCHSINLEKHNA